MEKRRQRLSSAFVCLTADSQDRLEPWLCHSPWDEVSETPWRDHMLEKPSNPLQAWIMSNPCFYLFAALLLLLILLPMFQNSEAGKLWFTAMNLPVLVSALVALGRSRSFWVALLLACPTFGLLVLSHFAGGSTYLAWSWRFSIAVFAVTLIHLVRYVLRPAGPDGMTIDRLYGGGSCLSAAWPAVVLFLCHPRIRCPELLYRPGSRQSPAHRRPGLFQLRPPHHGRRGGSRAPGEGGTDAGAP
jgi:hypothetical protein